MSFTEKLKEHAGLCSIALSDDQCDRFFEYYQLLVEGNKVMNLTSIVEEDEVITKHFLDSLAALNVTDLAQGSRVLDLGSGAGFPGIPLKIARPDLKMVLLDSLAKRVNFLTKTCDTIGLSGIDAVHGRAEEFGRKEEYRETFDYVVSRAVASLPVLLEYALPFVSVGGAFLAYKSLKSDEEIADSSKALSVLGSEIEKVENVDIPGLLADRKIIVIRKRKNISLKYPRNSRKIQKEHL